MYYPHSGVLMAKPGTKQNSKVEVMSLCTVEQLDQSEATGEKVTHRCVFMYTSACKRGAILFGMSVWGEVTTFNKVGDTVLSDRCGSQTLPDKFGRIPVSDDEYYM
ncbi:hypothetical protein T265_12208 [Opisthorchis viverrini]|uniref:Uncharacterized protein n=1 Tax=Opisthorchis viverrini TaxID=6198 RepID=A0A074Z5U8_OPIVI|nr:hypothetical protein T265_12208 [Opisthorchis viverrini]KER18635.1 hypothetical protein T265_12208 [Opisthorchis viverrini]